MFRPCCLSYINYKEKICREICWQKVRNMLGAEEIVHPLPSVFGFAVLSAPVVFMDGNLMT